MELATCSRRDLVKVCNATALCCDTSTSEFSMQRLASITIPTYLAIASYSMALLSGWNRVGPFYLRGRSPSKMLAPSTQKFLLHFSFYYHREVIMPICASGISFVSVAPNPSKALKLLAISNYSPSILGNIARKEGTRSISAALQSLHSVY